MNNETFDTYVERHNEKLHRILSDGDILTLVPYHLAHRAWQSGWSHALDGYHITTPLPAANTLKED